MKKRPKTTTKIPQTPDAFGGVPFYGAGDVPSPYIPFVVYYRERHWWRGWERKTWFVQASGVELAVLWFRLAFPSARIDLVASLKFHKTFPAYGNEKGGA